MSARFSNTTADYIEWSTALDTAHKLLKDKKSYVYGLYILIAIRTGLRIGDVLSLKYEDINSGKLVIREEKTNKPKVVQIHDEILKAIQGKSGYMFKSQKGTILSKQQINRKLKDIFEKQSRTLNISSHSLRKTFGRRVYEAQNESEKALVYLSDIFNHSSIAITRKYLGLRQEELNDIYTSI